MAQEFTKKKAKGRPHPVLAMVILVLSGLALYFGYGKSYISLSYDPHEVNCLPELHLALLVHAKPDKVARGAYLFWKASGVLAYVKEDFVLKKVAGVPGDRLLIKEGKVFINGAVVASGFDNAAFFKKTPKDFEREEVIPADRYFMIGTNPQSMDSRYWGYLSKDMIAGEGYRIY